MKNEKQNLKSDNQLIIKVPRFEVSILSVSRFIASSSSADFSSNRRFSMCVHEVDKK